MRKLILWVLGALLIAGCGSAPKDVVLTFEVADPVAKEVVVVCNTDIRTFTLDENGYCEAVLNNVDAAYARVFYGRNERTIYVEGGDCAVISFDADDYAGTFRFEGDKSQAVEYLKNVVLTPLPDESFALPFDEYVSKIEAKEKDALKLLKDNQIKKAGKFLEIETGRIRYSYATPLLMYPIGHMLMAQDPGYVPDEEYYKKIEEYFVADEDLLCLNEYRNFMIEAAHMLDAENRNVTELNPKTVAQMRFIVSKLDSPEVNETLLHYLAASYIDTFGIDGIEEMESIYKTYVKDTVMLADYAEKYDKWNVSKPGRISPDFDAVDIEGKKWTLADFRGKYIYIDMWATWCAPCKKEFPFLKELEEKFKDANIVFLGLSTDGVKENWEKMVRSGALTGTQLYLGPRSSFQLAYNIQGIPRFILLDRDGRIISNDMSRPSDNETIKVIESLEGIR